MLIIRIVGEPTFIPDFVSSDFRSTPNQNMAVTWCLVLEVSRALH